MPDGEVEKTPQIEIVPAMPGDSKGIQDLMRASVMATYVKGDVTEDDVADFYKEEQSPEGLEQLTKELTEPGAVVANFVAKDKNMVVGYCRVSKENPDNQNQNILTRIHVLPSRKGERIGKLLWNHAQSALDPNKKETVLWVVEDNVPSIEVYEKHWGFEKTGKRKEKKYKSGAARNEIEMVRRVA